MHRLVFLLLAACGLSSVAARRGGGGISERDIQVGFVNHSALLHCVFSNDDDQDAEDCLVCGEDSEQGTKDQVMLDCYEEFADKDLQSSCESYFDTLSSNVRKGTRMDRLPLWVSLLRCGNEFISKSFVSECAGDEEDAENEVEVMQDINQCVGERFKESFMRGMMMSGLDPKESRQGRQMSKGERKQKRAKAKLRVQGYCGLRGDSDRSDRAKASSCITCFQGVLRKGVHSEEGKESLMSCIDEHLPAEYETCRNMIEDDEEERDIKTCFNTQQMNLLIEDIMENRGEEIEGEEVEERFYSLRKIMHQEFMDFMKAYAPRSLRNKFLAKLRLMAPLEEEEEE